MVSLQSEQLSESKESSLDLANPAKEEMKKHPWWDEGKGWKNILNNLRLFVQALCYFNLLKPWLVVVFSPQVIRFGILVIIYPVEFSGKVSLSLVTCQY
jgi:hypothetical protein